MAHQIIITIIIVIIFYNIMTQLYNNNTELLQPSDHEELHCIKLQFRCKIYAIFLKFLVFKKSSAWIFLFIQQVEIIPFTFKVLGSTMCLDVPFLRV